jgi:hypothetical protein
MLRSVKLPFSKNNSILLYYKEIQIFPHRYYIEGVFDSLNSNNDEMYLKYGN